MKKWSIVLIMLIASSFFIFATSYKGDGLYTTDGIWPLKSYKLELPPVELSSGNEVNYKIRGYSSHGTSHLKIVLYSDSPIQYADIDTVVEVQITSGYTTYFYRKSPVNAHYLRMVKLGEAKYATEYEWAGEYRYVSKDIDQRVVSFSPTELPMEVKQMEYWHSIPTGTNDYNVKIRIANVPTEYQNIRMQLILLSGWK